LVTVIDARVTVPLGVVTVTWNSPGELTDAVQVKGAADPVCACTVFRYREARCCR